MEWQYKWSHTIKVWQYKLGSVSMVDMINGAKKSGGHEWWKRPNYLPIIFVLWLVVGTSNLV